MINQLVPHSVTVVFQLTLCHLFLTFGTKVPRFHYCLVKVLTVTDDIPHACWQTEDYQTSCKQSLPPPIAVALIYPIGIAKPLFQSDTTTILLSQVKTQYLQI